MRKQQTQREAQTARIRVLLVDDHPVVREGVAAMIAQQSDMEVVGEASDGSEAVALYARHRPDVALIDLRMPGVDGVTTIERIRSAHPEARVVVLTTYDTDDDITRGLRAGASGYLLKDLPRGDLLRGIRDVHAGRTSVAPAVAARLAERVTQPLPTDRELEVLRLVAEGRSNKEIAADLFVTEGTVKVHLTNLFAKLRVASRTEAIAAGVRRGLVRMS